MFLLYIHTLETFPFEVLKKSSREKDESKILTLGPYSFALSFILAHPKPNQNPKGLIVYRGMQVPINLFIEEFY